MFMDIHAYRYLFALTKKCSICKFAQLVWSLPTTHSGDQESRGAADCMQDALLSQHNCLIRHLRSFTQVQGILHELQQ